MSYISLYRKYRSQDFDSIVGQKHIVQTLKNAVENNRLAHAYIFSGPRGTGKTSMARILAKALNCRTGITVKPCLQCDLCEAIKNGTSVDVIEIDAASNRGIDEIRQLREQVNFMPAEGRYKVYIIDEVHMLTNEAFNALLKTLEEPPSHTVFVLATTEIQKIPATILSRCQRLDFKRITAAEINEHLKWVAQQEAVIIDSKSLDYLAKIVDGGMRDALSLFDQLISYKGKTLNFDDVLSVLGTSDFPVLNNLSDKLLAKNTEQTIAYLNDLILSGKNVSQLAKDFVEYLRNLLFVKIGAVSGVELAQESVEILKKQAELISLAELKKIVQNFARAEADMRWQPNAKLVFELAIIETCLQVSEVPVAAVKPVSNVAVKTQTVAVTPPEKIIPSVEIKKNFVSEVKPSPSPGPVITKPVISGQLSLVEVKQHWLNVQNKVKYIKQSLNSLLCEGHPVAFENNMIVVKFQDNFSFHRDRLMQEKNKAVIENVFKEVFGQDIKLKGVLESESSKSTEVAAKPAVTIKPVESKTDQLVKMFGGSVVST